MDISEHLINEFGKICLVNEDERVYYKKKGFEHSEGVRRAFGLDPLLADYSGTNVIEVYFYTPLDLWDVVKIDDVVYGVLEIESISDGYFSVILYEDDYIVDFVFRKLKPREDKFGEIQIEDSEKVQPIEAKGRLRTPPKRGDLELPIGFVDERKKAKRITHSITLKYDSKYEVIDDTWIVEGVGKIFIIESFLNFNEQSKFLKFECYRSE